MVCVCFQASTSTDAEAERIDKDLADGLAAWIDTTTNNAGAAMDAVGQAGACTSHMVVDPWRVLGWRGLCGVSDLSSMLCVL